MHQLMVNRYKKVMILGAAQGLGASFTNLLIPGAEKIWLVDIDGAALENTVVRLREEGATGIGHITLDLGEAHAPAKLEQVIRQEELDLLIYVAAHSRVGPFLELKGEDLHRTLAVNILSLTRICHAFGKACKEDGRKGGLILVSSLAGWWGLPGVSLYGASKAFIWNLAEGLYTEWRSHGIDVLGLICGAMDTPGFRRSAPRPAGLPMEDPDRAAREALQNLGRRSLWVAGLTSRLSHLLLNRVFPRSLSRWIMARQLHRMYPEKVQVP